MINDGLSPAAVAVRIASLRGRHSQQDFADILGVNRNTVLRAESGNGYPSVKFLNALYEKLGVLQTWVLTGDGPRDRGGRQGAGGDRRVKDPTLGLVEIWLDELCKTEGEGRRDWFRYELADKFPTLGKFIAEREAAEAEVDSGQSSQKLA